MTEKNVQIKFRNSEGGYDDIFPKTKEELVEGLSTSLDGKVDKEAGKGLSTEDYTTIEKNKLAGVEVGAEKNVVTKVNDKIGVIVLTGEDIKVGTGVGVTVAQQLEALFNDIINKSDKTHNHTLASLSEKSYNSLTDKPSLGTVASKNTGTSSGQIPILDSGGKLDTAVLPPLAITEPFVVNSQSAMLALTAQTGDVAIRSDIDKTYILSKEPASTLANWLEILTPPSAVKSVNGKTGVVTISKGDVGLGNVDNKSSSTIRGEITSSNVTSALGFTPVTNARKVAGKALSSDITLSKSDVGLSNVDNAKQATKAEFDTHNSDTTKHVTEIERNEWNRGIKCYTKVIGDGSETHFNFLNIPNPLGVFVTEASTGNQVYCDTTFEYNENIVSVMFATPPTEGQYRVNVFSGSAMTISG